MGWTNHIPPFLLWINSWDRHPSQLLGTYIWCKDLNPGVEPLLAPQPRHTGPHKPVGGGKISDNRLWHPSMTSLFSLKSIFGWTLLPLPFYAIFLVSSHPQATFHLYVIQYYNALLRFRIHVWGPWKRNSMWRQLSRPSFHWAMSTVLLHETTHWCRPNSQYLAALILRIHPLIWFLDFSLFLSYAMSNHFQRWTAFVSNW
jgi:hypothetical protein